MLYTLFVDISNFCSPSLKTCSLQETAGANVTRNTLQWKKGFFRELSICVPAVSSGYRVKIMISQMSAFTFEFLLLTGIYGHASLSDNHLWAALM